MVLADNTGPKATGIGFEMEVNGMNSVELQQFFVLELVNHGGALDMQKRHGGQNRRYLNKTGRWSGEGSESVPVLVWDSLESATEAAKKATQARGRKIDVGSLGRQDTTGFKSFEDSDQPALRGYLAYTGVAAVKLEAERLKTMRYASAVFNVLSAKKKDDFEALYKKETLKLRTNFKGGTVYSASQYLTGQRAKDIADRVLDGELACDEDMTPEKLSFAIQMASTLPARLATSH